MKPPRRDRTALRTLLFFITLGTIPLYLLGIGLWLFAPAPADGGRNPLPDPTWTPLNGAEATWTPLGQDGGGGMTPVIATGFPTLTLIPTLDFNFSQPTVPGGVFAPPIGSNPAATFVVGTPIFVATASPLPTRFMTVTPAPTLAASATPISVPTNPPAVNPPPVATVPLLLPPTDTPAP